MDSTQIIVTIGGAVLIALTLWFFFGKRQQNRAGGKELLYSCPMHPWITSPEPTAVCSLCGMKLLRDDSGKKAS